MTEVEVLQKIEENNAKMLDLLKKIDSLEEKKKNILDEMREIFNQNLKAK